MDDDFRSDDLISGGVFGGLHDDEEEPLDSDESDFAPEEEF